MFSFEARLFDVMKYFGRKQLDLENSSLRDLTKTNMTVCVGREPNCFYCTFIGIMCCWQKISKNFGKLFKCLPNTKNLKRKDQFSVG